LSIQELQVFYVVFMQKVSKPIDIQTATGILADLSSWCVHSQTPEDVSSAIDLQSRFYLSFWDAMIIRSTQKQGCQV